MLIITGVIFLSSVSALSEVNRDCIAENKASTSNEALLGTWYRVYQFTLMGSTSSTDYCPELKFDTATAGEIEAFRRKYNNSGHPYVIDDNSMILDYGSYYGLLSGNTEAKFFVLEPKSNMRLNPEGYEVEVYRKINDNYVLYWRCAMRGHDRYLLARNRDASNEEHLQVIAGIKELERMNPRRYCMVYPWKYDNRKS